jgi:hypothetical protein
MTEFLGDSDFQRRLLTKSAQFTPLEAAGFPAGRFRLPPFRGQADDFLL